jgi:hypothetical protein
MESSPDSPLTVTILFSDGTRATYSLPSNSTGSTLLSQIRSDPAMTRYSDHTLSLLFLGNAILPDQLLSALSPSPTFSVQCFTRPARPAVASPTDTEERPEGFDRLSRASYSADQIARLRSLFHSVHHSENLPENERLALEDEWVPAITLAGSPMAAFRVIQLMRNAPVGPRPIRMIPTLEPPREIGSEAESPLLQQEEGEPPAVESSWLPFILGVIVGMIFGKDVLLSIPFCVCGFPLFGIGLAFGGMLMIVLKLT